jgi:hypothetical protein
VSGHAGRNTRKPMQETPSQTEAKDASSEVDGLRQGTLFLPVERDAALQATSRLMHRSRALHKRGSQLRPHLRTAIPLTFPE